MKKLIMAVIASFMVTGVFAGEKLILDLPFSDATGVNDQSTFENNGTLVGTATIKNGALLLDGSKKCYVDCGKKTDTVLGKSDITIIAKVKLALKQKNTIIGIVSKGAAENKDAGYVLFYNVTRKALVFCVSNGKKRSSFYSKKMILDDDKWHSVAVTAKRGDEVIFSLDGEAFVTEGIAFSPNPEEINNKKRALLIGSWVKSHILNGAIKDVRIYKKAFSAEELVKLNFAKK